MLETVLIDVTTPCPRGKRSGKGKGKFAHQMDYGNAMFQSKGKGKKGKTKSSQASWSAWPEPCGCPAKTRKRASYPVSACTDCGTTALCAIYA